MTAGLNVQAKTAAEGQKRDGPVGARLRAQAGGQRTTGKPGGRVVGIWAPDLPPLP